MAPPQAISILCQMELHLFMSPTYGFLAGAILAKGCRPDFNNGLRGDSNSGPILPPGVYSSLTRIMAPPQAISILCQIELHLFMSPTYGFLTGAISGQGLQACTSIMASKVTRIVTPFCAPGVYSSLTRIMAPPQANPILNCKHELAQKLF